MSGEVVHHLVQLPYRHFERTPSGVIAERLRQLDVLRGFFTGQMPVLAIDLAFVALFLAATFAISTTLGIVTTLALPVVIARVEGGIFRPVTTLPALPSDPYLARDRMPVAPPQLRVVS